MSNDAFYQLAKANVLETVRDRLTLIFTTIFPMLFIGLFVLINSMTPDLTTIGLVTVGQDFPRSAVVGALGSDYSVFDVSAEQALTQVTNGQLEVVVAQSTADTVTVTGSTESIDAVAEVVLLLSDAGVGTVATGTPVEGSPPFDAIRFGIPGVLVMALTSLALLGLASALVAQRARGTLKMFGLTPVRTSTFLLAQVPGRVMIAAVQTAVLLTVAALTGFLDIGGIAGTLAVVVVGLAMLLALGYFLGGILPSPELAQGLLSGFIPIALMFSGVLLPLFIMPDAIATAARVSPFFYLGDALRQVITGDVGEYPLAVDLLVMAGIAAVATLLATKTFRWDTRSAR
jgi:ABC-2 type transport system permease protein